LSGMTCPWPIIDSTFEMGLKKRLDRVLVERGLVDSREKGKAIIMAGLVEVDGKRVEKSGSLIPSSAEVIIRKPHTAYVSRGGHKLEAAITHFSIDVAGRVILDVGASTGGFTDCLLQHGAQGVIAVDVGYGQLDWKLRQDPRVTVLERTNIRYLQPRSLPKVPQGAVIDTAFISLRLVVPAVMNLLPKRSFVVALIKPQFEVGKGRVGKGGVVRDPAIHQEVIDELTRFFETKGWDIKGDIPSPILGPKGNREFLIYMKR
jgi:23S rRNA (cytidine1920-2'-O)/16S rRNA (cytidine1409-2'-O)-methyltransferase